MSNKTKLEAVASEKPTTEEMKAFLLAERQAREIRALERVRQVLQEERCSMNPVFTVTVQGVIPRIDITAVD